jgi:hypothetical protein
MHISDLQAIKDLVAAQISTLKYGVTGFTATRAGEYVDTLLKP